MSVLTERKRRPGSAPSAERSTLPCHDLSVDLVDATKQTDEEQAVKTKSKKSKNKARPQRVPVPTKGRYSDGHPRDKVHYLESKIILKGDRFTSVDSFTELTKLVRRAAEHTDIGFSRK